MSILKRLESETISLSEADIIAGMTKECGIKKKQAEILGVPWPLKTGWIARAVGTVIRQSDYEKFMGMAGARSKNLPLVSKKKPNRRKDPVDVQMKRNLSNAFGHKYNRPNVVGFKKPNPDRFKKHVPTQVPQVQLSIRELADLMYKQDQ